MSDPVGGTQSREDDENFDRYVMEEERTTGTWVRRSTGSRWGWRTIRNGTVKWFGRTYRVKDNPPAGAGVFLQALDGAQFVAGLRDENPVDRRADHVPYDGRLDGRRALFSDYGPRCPNLAHLVFLHHVAREPWPGPNCIGGVFRWERWEVVA